MNEDKQCLQRDTTEGRCLEEGCGKNMLDDCMFLCRTSVSFQPTCCCSVTLLMWSVARKCCSSQVSLCVAQHCYLRNMRHTTRWLWYGLRDQSTLRITEPDTARTETQRAPMSPYETHFHDSRLYRAKERVLAHHPRTDCLILCCRCPRCMHNSSWSFEFFSLTEDSKKKLNYKNPKKCKTSKT